MSIKKLMKKVNLGYRYTTNDLVNFEYDKVKGLLRISDFNNEIILDATENTIFMLYEFFRYIKTDE